jgi:5-methylcytosine-specific restriction enzyme A
MQSKRKLPTLKPRLQVLDPWAARGLKTLAEVKKASKRTGRDADPRRTIPLNSAAWQRLRASVLSGEPLCRHCTQDGKTVPATDVDHRDGNPANNDPINLQPLCHAHHSRKTAQDHGKRVAHGCDEEGMPLDPDHPWNRGTVAPLLQKSPATDAPRPTGSSRVIAKSKRP